MKRLFYLTRKIQRAQSADHIPFFRHRQRQRNRFINRPRHNRLKAHFFIKPASCSGGTARPVGSGGKIATDARGAIFCSMFR